MTIFAGKAVLVTGAASGIGKAAAIRFAQEGARVFAADLNAEGVRQLAGDIGNGAVAIEVDVASAAANEAMVAAAVHAAGGVDVAFLNAGYLGPMDGLEATDEALFDRHVAINLKGVFLGIKSLLPAMRPGGAVVVTSSTAGLLGLHESPAYSAAKHGVIGLVKSCTPAFAARGVRINAICPGAVATPMIGGEDSGIVAPADLQRVALRDMGSAQHVAELALWLASPAAGYVNGQAHIADAALLSTFVPSEPGP
ncbi:SDR family oxidoreductase [Sphingopyxis sp. OPL5]|uniref:SDR family NAD(P)-dependent oxidoreductase n=1 Tax=Sphingopyxis sp. OPL5 TaxID=2486273 RepID=UPI00164E8424|nr:SDR family oxidoreductase [Sphingopyxis sp. OPL5]QNO27926.1 SDR family oxidoreductase [Sphingopyxis sp. OPL5]